MKVRGWKNIFHVNGNQKTAKVAILMSDKIDLKIKNITRDKEAHYIMIKGSIQEDITVANIYASNIGAISIYKVNTNIIKGGIDGNTIVVGDFNIPLTPTEKSLKQRINKETQTLNKTLDQMDLIDIFRNFHPNAEYTFFSSAHGTFSRIDHILGHKASLSKFKKMEIILSTFSNCSAMRLEINHKKKI